MDFSFLRPLEKEDAGRCLPFLWGVATSPYQHEGGYNGPGEPQNNWAWAEAAARVERSGEAVGFWKRAESFLEEVARLGLNAFRMGIGWERVQPVRFLHSQKRAARMVPPFDQEALDRYAAILAYCRKLGLEPVVTLHHFTHPAWLGPDAWLSDGTVVAFEKFVHKTVSYFLKVLPADYGCPPPRFYLTINEPNVLALCGYFFPLFPVTQTHGLRAMLGALARLLEAHVRAFDCIHELYQGLGLYPWVSLNLHASNLYWLDMAWWDLLHAGPLGLKPDQAFAYLKDRARSLERRLKKELSLRFPLSQRILGDWFRCLHHGIAHLLPSERCWRRLVRLLGSRPSPPLDFVAFDYYLPLVEDWFHRPRLKEFGGLKGKNWAQRLASLCTVRWWEWPCRASALEWFVTQLAEFGLPLLVAENGMAERATERARPDGVSRSEYIIQHVRELVRLRREGHPLFGYFYWSLVDNYEWGTYEPEFGLFSLSPEGRLQEKTSGSDGDSAAEVFAQEVAKAQELVGV
ncbi:family 1 glycosylhydrolase [Candidatus Methylacidithermus pantelleriae]|uniref:6-phospho-beta-galactosidase n=1 Tax=Candidatus Methylacidithermus pantelleriae TaxID=2744239 RepID=A0A8J2BS36_9BACT|nr:family 1 glycosylhydrolase [Candidatus Methylacidithermus pantelleriae]CAF0694006.1 6-phospho-beta-galactosidase [Candidatus Methylacidithermus pantelleriae]